MKTALFFSLFSAASLWAAPNVLRPELHALRLNKSGADISLKSDLWNKAPEYPMLKNAKIASEFHYMPVEGSRIRMLADKMNLYIKADMEDSDIVSEAAGTKVMPQRSADSLIVVLRPLSSTGFFHIECTPDKIVYCAFVPGGGLTNLPSTALQFPVKIPVETAVSGTLNNQKDRDKAWSVVVTVPVQQLLSELRKQGFAVRAEDGWSLMVGRKNFSRFLNEPETSGFPQPAPGFFDDLPAHALLLMKQEL